MESLSAQSKPTHFLLLVMEWVLLKAKEELFSRPEASTVATVTRTERLVAVLGWGSVRWGCREAGIYSPGKHPLGVSH